MAPGARRTYSRESGVVREVGGGHDGSVRSGDTDKLYKGPLPEGISIRGKRSIRIRFSWSGKRRSEVLRMVPTRRNVQFAARKREAILHEIAMGTFDYAKHFPNSRQLRKLKAGEPTLNSLLLAWLEGQRRETAPSTWFDYRNTIRNHLIPALGWEYDDRGNRVRERAVSEITKSQIKAWIGGLSGVSAKRINNLMIPLRGALGDALEDEIIARNPMATVSNLEKDTFSRPDPFSPSEVRAILSNAGDDRWLWQYAISSGMRPSELLALEVRDIDWTRNVVSVGRVIVRGHEREGSKTGESGMRAVWILPPAKEALRQALALQERVLGRPPGPTDKVFISPRTGKPYPSSKRLEKRWIATLQAAGVRILHVSQPRNGKKRYRSMYQTRHTYVSTLLTLGVDPTWIAKQVGHVDWGMIRKVYGTWIPEVRPDAAEPAKNLDQIWTVAEAKQGNSGQFGAEVEPHIASYFNKIWRSGRDSNS